MGLKQYISESAINVILEGKMEVELASQIHNKLKRDKKIYMNLSSQFSVAITFADTPSSRTLPPPEIAEQAAEQILKIDPTPRKSWRFIIKEWLFSGAVVFPEDGPKLAQELQLAKKFNLTQYDKFKTRESLYEFLENIKRNRGIVDEYFNYTFDIDYSNTRFTIYHIQAKDKAEYIAKLGDCTTWCISTDRMFDYYDLPYYLLVDKAEKKQYAIVPSGGQFKDSKQNADNSEKRFEEFDKILKLRERYYTVVPTKVELIDGYIYEHPIFDKRQDIKVALIGIAGATINSDGTIDVNGSVYITDKHVEQGKLKYKFGNVSGIFNCSVNKLTTLEGAPKEVGGDFNCYGNDLTSLEGGPVKVGGAFYCRDNMLTSLDGAPKEVSGGFYCYENNLTSLEGAPKYVGGPFGCNNNKLTSLEGGPKEVSGDFLCGYNKLTTLKGAPEKVDGGFYCCNNNLTSLDGIGEVKGKIISDIE